jgi:hypothetical protein
MNGRGDWLQTYTGKKFHPLDPRPEDICIEDIAHALALICRYNGHCKFPYSVAQHSLLMSWWGKINDIDRRWLLLHDAAEAYISDVPSPIKPMLSEFSRIEHNIMEVIAAKFELGKPDMNFIKFADLAMLATEKRDVLNPGGPAWGIWLPEPAACKIHQWPWWEAEWQFLRESWELGIGIC